MSARFNEQEQKIREIHERELTEKLEEFERSYPPNPKPSVEVLNLNKVLEQAVKQKDFTKAHHIQVQIAELTTAENIKFLDEKEKKIRKEAEKIKTKQDNELNAFNLKTQAAYNEFKKNRAFEFDTAIVRYKNRIKELETNQKLEIGSLPKILKGIVRPNSRISNIMKSASNFNNLQNSKSSKNNLNFNNPA